MKIDTSDLELLIELMPLISKYGIEKMEKVILLLKNQNSIDDIICILEKSVSLLKSKHEKINHTNKQKDNNVETANNITVETISNILKDRRAFKNIKELDEFIKKYIPQGIHKLKRRDMIEAFSIYIYNQDEKKQKEILKDINRYLPTKNKKEESCKNDLKSWSDIIMKSNK